MTHPSSSSFETRPLSAALGVEVRGADLAGPDAEAQWDELHRLFLAHHVLCIRDQKLEPESQLAFARRFGRPEIHPIVEGTDEHPEVVRVFKPAGESASFGVGWHTDNSFFAEPSLGSILYGVTIPPVGGDTLYANQELAWDALSPALQERLMGLHGVHSASRAYDPATTGTAKYEGKASIRYRWSDSIREEVVHPVVRTHPETGRRSLYVNPMFTLRIAELHEGEGRALLGFLFEHCARPEFQARLRWEPGTVAVWDNRCVWHYAMDDYRDHDRLMMRVTIAGDRPV